VRTYRILDAVACLDAWLGRLPDDPQALFLRGNAWRQAGAVQKAVPDYRRAVELDPERDDARWWLAVGLQEIGRYDRALPHLEPLLRQRPGDADVLVLMARCLNGLDRTEEARHTLAAVLADHPDNGLALRTQGQIALQAGQPAEAESRLRQAVALLPND